MYASQIYLNDEPQVKCPDAQVYTSHTMATVYGGGSRLRGGFGNAPPSPRRSLLVLSACLSLCLVCGFTLSISPVLNWSFI